MYLCLFSVFYIFLYFRYLSYLFYFMYFYMFVLYAYTFISYLCVFLNHLVLIYLFIPTCCPTIFRKSVHLNHVNVLPLSRPSVSPLGCSGAPYTRTQLSQVVLGTEKPLRSAAPCVLGGGGVEAVAWALLPSGGPSGRVLGSIPGPLSAPGILQNSPRPRQAAPWRWQVGSSNVSPPVPAGCSRKGTELKRDGGCWHRNCILCFNIDLHWRHPLPRCHFSRHWYTPIMKGRQAIEKAERREDVAKAEGMSSSSTSVRYRARNAAWASLSQVQLCFLGQWFATFTGLQPATTCQASPHLALPSNIRCPCGQFVALRLLA